MSKDQQLSLKRFFKDDNGRIVLWQWPNLPLWGWLVFKVLSFVLAKGHFKSGCESLSTAFLFIWAYLEVTKGVNYFRKLLGLVVLIALVTSYFK